MRSAVAALGVALGVAAMAVVGAATFSDRLLDRPVATAGEPAASSAGSAASRRALVDSARALVDVSPADLRYRLVVRGPRDAIRGATDTKLRTITLYVRAGDAAHRVAHDLAHEIGHAYDAERLSFVQRIAWLRARGAPAAGWFPGGRASDYSTGAGDFAEVFARCHAASPEFRSRVAGRPADACALLPAGARTDRLGDR